MANRGRPPKVDHLRESFIKDIDSAKNLVLKVKSVAGINPNSSTPRIHVKHAQRVTELAFMGVVASWEDFLEQVLVRYLAGAKTDSGYQPSLRIGVTASISHSYEIIMGDPKFNPYKNYIGFGSPNDVLNVAKLYINHGQPFQNAMNPKIEMLKNAVKIRNRTAHSSTKCINDFVETARKMLDQEKLKQSYRPANLLEAKAERGFGRSAKDRGITFFEAFMEMYENLAKSIVPVS